MDFLTLGAAFLAGILTILSPCVLPVLPIVFGSATAQHRLAPAALALGLAISFTAIGLFIATVGFTLGLDARLFRTVSGALLILFGIVLLVPQAQAAFQAALAPLGNWANSRTSTIEGSGLAGQFGLGLLLGAVWSPCVGPTLGAAIAAASQGEDLFQAFLTFLTFALGVGLSITLFAYASRKALGWNTKRLQSLARYAKPIFGAVLLLVGALVVTGLDKAIEAWILGMLPDWLISITTRF